LKGTLEVEASTQVEDLGGRSTAQWRYAIPPEELALWGEGFTATVDPADDVVESDEFNNTYTVGSARLLRVHFYKIDIHNDHEPAYRGKGEFEFIFWASGFRNGEKVVNEYEWRSYHWGEGEHAMNLSISPNLLSSDDLAIHVAGYECDTEGAEVGDSDDIGNVDYLHSHDGAQTGSWKGGGDFSATSDIGDYTVYWRLEMAE
jgi:hypothetical protein